MKVGKLRRGKIHSLIVLAAAIALAVVLAGCGSADEPVIEPTVPIYSSADGQVTEPTVPDYSEKPGLEDQYIHSHPVGTVARYDLNGDGIGENISVETHEYEEGKLVVGNASVEFWSAAPTEYFSVINADESEDMLLVGISDYGPSDDPVTVFYAYDGTSLREVGFLDDIFGQNAWGYDSAVCHGDGTVTAGRRWDVLGTWNTMGLYRVNETGITDITEFYPYIGWEDQTSWEVKAKVDVLTYGHAEDLTMETLETVPAGTVMRMTGLRKGESDSSFWVAFEVDNMGTRWILVERMDWIYYVHTGIGFVDSEEAFEGFFYAG